MADTLHTFYQGLSGVVIEAHRRGFSVQSNFARDRADYVAMAASMGLISTKVVLNIYSRDWRPTVAGLLFLQSLELEDFD